MKLKSLRIENFRSFEDETITFRDYTSFVGQNGAGKSTVFHALNVLFGDDQTPGLNPNELTEDDFHGKNTEEPVRLTVTFFDLNADAQEDFKDYYRQEQLVITATAQYDPSTGRASVKQYGQRSGIPAFADFFEAEKDSSVKVDGLREIYGALKKRFADLPEISTKAGMSGALHEYENSHPEVCKEIESGDLFYGVSKGKHLLEKHVQWVYVPAVKEFSTEVREARDTFLGKLLARTVRQKVSFDEGIDAIRTTARGQYDELLKRSEKALEDTSKALCERIATWAHPEATLRLEWDHDGEKAVQITQPFAKTIAGEGDFEGHLSRFGHGFQRAYLLTILEELATGDTSTGPTLIIACEEPELYQHPPQARHLYDVMSKLALGNTQVIVCTHSPYFVSGDQFEDVRLVRKTNGHTTVFGTTIEEITQELAAVDKKQDLGAQGTIAKIHQVLQPNLNEMFFASKVVLVEGLEDVAYIATYMQLLQLWDEYRRLGCHIVPVNGKSEIARPLAIANRLQIPAFIVFDADGETDEANGRRAMHEKDNRVNLALCGLSHKDAFPKETLYTDRCVLWPTEIGRVVKDEIGEEQWQVCAAQASTDFDNAPDLRKNTLYVSRVLELAWQTERKSKSLEALCTQIIAFAAAAS